MQEKKIEQGRDSPEEEHNRKLDSNQNMIAFKSDEGKSIGSPVTKKRGTFYLFTCYVLNGKNETALFIF